MRKIFNKNMKISVSIISIFLITLISCDDVLEEDITDDNITITAPLNGATVVSNTATFQWNSLNDADEYRVQVNNASNVIVLDSLVSINSFTSPLSPGEYSWRVRGENFAYQTAYTFPASFTLEASTDLTDQTVILLSPSDNFPTNTTTGQLVTWTGIATADSYSIEIDRVVSGSVSTISQITDITDTSYTISSTDMSVDAVYIWKVKALNTATITETVYATRKILLDTQAPSAASLSTPGIDATESLDTAVLFVWNNPSDSGVTSVTSVLEIADEISFTGIIQTYNLAASSQSHSFTATGDYFWRVKNIDAAGNSSNYTTPRKVTIN
ncbi:MAG: hypothetical protein COA88_09235 [Kordia sp.]|nr:MAG: hypothetical protein COA88_09235 [Kordia sp.]